MPKFEIMPAADVPRAEPTGRRAELLNEYMGYIEQIGRRRASKLTPVEDETPQAVRRRLGAVAKQAGANLIVRYGGPDIYFWKKPRRGRPPKVT